LGFDINVNGTANLNITVDADDTLARQMINETQEDVYGTETGSGPKDMILDEIKTSAGNPITETEGLESIEEICSDPYLQQYLSKIGTLPPLEFVDYVKALGYDDEAHINLIWTMCQQQYINQNQGQWSSDSGMQPIDVVRYITGAIDWLLGRDTNPLPAYKQIGYALESYFASDKDIWTLVNKINELELRIKVLEKTMDRVASETYCQAKIDIMMEYNLSYVKCGEDSTIYARVNSSEFGYDIIGYTTEDQCIENWACTSWSECKDGISERTCADVNKCGTAENKPTETNSCTGEIVTENLEPQALTGSFISVQKNIHNFFSSIQNFLYPLIAI